MSSKYCIHVFQNTKQWPVCETCGCHFNNFYSCICSVHLNWPQPLSPQFHRIIDCWTITNVTTGLSTWNSQKIWNGLLTFWRWGHGKGELSLSRFFFISLFLMYYHFTSNLNQGASVILRKSPWCILQGTTDMRIQTMCKNFILQFRMKLFYLEWIKLWRRTRGLLVLINFCVIKTQHSIFEALCNHNLSF